MFAKITGLEVYLPENIMTNDDFAKYLDTSDEWISQMTGIKERRIENELSLLEMIHQSLDKFDQGSLDNVDAIIVSSMSNDFKSPSLAAMVTKKVPSTSICFDINSACSGFVYGLEIADNFIKSNNYKKVLFIAAEKMSNLLNMDDRNTAILFGDGVCSVILEASENKHVSDTYFKSLGNIEDLVVYDKLEMMGKNVFKFAVRSVGECLETVNINEIDYFVFHQANIRIIDTIIKKYNLDADKVLTNLENFGNTSSASIGILLSEYKFKPGEKVMLVGFGAGLSYGSLVYTV